MRGKTSSFSVVEGNNAVLKFSADEGNRLKSVKVNGQDVMTAITNSQYTISNITTTIVVEVAFEAIPSYTLNIAAAGNGSASYNETTIRNQSQNYMINLLNINILADYFVKGHKKQKNNPDENQIINNIVRIIGKSQLIFLLFICINVNPKNVNG